MMCHSRFMKERRWELLENPDAEDDMRKNLHWYV